jgi:cell division septum initiation protein DivIVA
MVCEEALCILCFATKHTGHTSAEIDEVADEFKRGLKESVLQLGDGVNRLTDSLSTFQTNRHQLLDQFNEVEREICSKADTLQSMIEHRKQQLIAELTQVKAEKLKEADAIVNEVTHNKVLIESLKKYNEELLRKGSNGDIARETKFLNIRIAKAKQFYKCEKPIFTPDTSVMFVSSDATQETSFIAVGKLVRTTG